MENTDWADYKTILSHSGKIDGLVGTCKIEEFIDKLDESLINSFLKSKGILINFKFHKNQSLSMISDYMDKINDLAHVEAEIIFSTEIIDNIDEEILEYEIILTGL